MKVIFAISLILILTACSESDDKEVLNAIKDNLSTQSGLIDASNIKSITGEVISGYRNKGIFTNIHTPGVPNIDFLETPILELGTSASSGVQTSAVVPDTGFCESGKVALVDQGGFIYDQCQINIEGFTIVIDGKIVFKFSGPFGSCPPKQESSLSLIVENYSMVSDLGTMRMDGTYKLTLTIEDDPESLIPCTIWTTAFTTDHFIVESEQWVNEIDNYSLSFTRNMITGETVRRHAEAQMGLPSAGGIIDIKTENDLVPSGEYFSQGLISINDHLGNSATIEITTAEDVSSAVKVIYNGIEQTFSWSELRQFF